jgi:hypothetical protein
MEPAAGAGGGGGGGGGGGCPHPQHHNQGQGWGGGGDGGGFAAGASSSMFWGESRVRAQQVRCDHHAILVLCCAPNPTNPLPFYHHVRWPSSGPRSTAWRSW